MTPKKFNPAQVKAEVTLQEFPKVFKTNNGCKTFVTIIYRDHSETYEQISTANETKLQAQDKSLHYSPHSEEEMERGNGGRQVHCNVETHTVILYSDKPKTAEVTLICGYCHDKVSGSDFKEAFLQMENHKKTKHPELPWTNMQFTQETTAQ